MANIIKGNINDVIEASKNGLSINLLRKSFDKEIIKSLKINDSMFARCTFINASIYASSFTDCIFVKCDFTGADIYGLSFSNCSFNECKFDNVTFNSTKFDEKCVLNKCTFDGVDLSDPMQIIGVDPKMFNVICENKPIHTLLNIGFIFNDNEYYMESPDGICKVYISFDSESNYYRCIVFADNISIITNDITDINAYSEETLKAMIKNTIELAIRKIGSDDSINELIDINDVKKSFDSLLTNF